MKILPLGDDEVSPVTGSRHSETWLMPMSSRAQPVTAMAPTMPVALFVGVSTDPNGSAPDAWTRSVTGTVSGEFETPVAVTVTVPVMLAPAEYVPGLTETAEPARCRRPTPASRRAT